MRRPNLNDGDGSPAWDLACELAADTREQHRHEDRAQDTRELQAIREAARALGLASAASLAPEERSLRAKRAGMASAKAMTPAQRTERARNAAASRWNKKRGAKP